MLAKQISDKTPCFHFAGFHTIPIATGRSAGLQSFFALALASCGTVFELVSCISGFLDIVLLFLVLLLRRAFTKDIYFVAVGVVGAIQAVFLDG